jgi:hypothetical protein
MTSRKQTPPQTEADVLITSRRRCALCYGLFGDLDQKRGQIAHVDRDPSNSAFQNLAFLCLPHHDEYDSKTSQSKRFTSTELLKYRDLLYERLGKGVTDEHAEMASAPSSRDSAPLTPSPRDAARQEACVELERDAGYLVERLSSWARLEADEQVLWATVKRFESNVGLVRRDQRLTQAVRDFAHQCMILLSDKGMFDLPQQRPAELRELRAFFDAFILEVDRFASGGYETTGRVPSATSIDVTPFFSLVGASFSAGVLDLHVRNDGAPVTCLNFETSTPGCHIRQWYPTSLPTKELFRAMVDLDKPEMPSCVFRMRVRDRGGVERAFQMSLDRRSSPQRFDFIEI